MNAAPVDAVNSSTRLPCLDGLRGLAIALVLAHNLDMLDDAPSLVTRLLNFGFDSGWTGVQLFFVLSGFLITGILLDTRRSANYFSSFFGRRVLRIFPLYYGSLFVMFVVLPWLGALPALFKHDHEHQAWFWFYLSNWRADNWEAFPHYWSLAVEEQFYLLWPLVVHRCSARRLLAVCGALTISSFIVRLGMRWADVKPALVYTSSLCRMDALAMGAAVAVVVRNPDWLTKLAPRGASVLTAAAAVALLGAFASHGFQRMSFNGQTWGYSALSVAFALLVLAAVLVDHGHVRTWWRSALACKPLRTLGKYSYAMYVFHRPLHKLVGEPALHAMGVDARQSSLLCTAYVLVISLMTLGIAMVSYRVIERPFLRLKGRFVARP